MYKESKDTLSTLPHNATYYPNQLNLIKIYSLRRDARWRGFLLINWFLQ